MTTTTIPANDPTLRSWVPVPEGSDFPVQNLPFGIAYDLEGHRPPRVCSTVGDQIVDLAILNNLSFFDGIGLDPGTLEQPTLNAFIRQGKAITSAVRNRLSELLAEGPGSEKARQYAHLFLMHRDTMRMGMPLAVGDYTDFYSSIEHATNVGSMFRDPANALLPNWRHLPVGYHGRASSITVSGTPVHRPYGQTMPDGAEQPVFGPTRLLDFELEMAFVIGRDTRIGQQVPTAQAEDYIFGLTLFNDWSARDIQKWEYVPLGPFLAKNFISTISPWIITLDALEPFRTAGPVQSPEVLPYLRCEGRRNYDLHLEVDITTPSGATQTVCRSNFKYMYWNMCQQLAHHTVNGCNIRVGDMMASGTISGPTPDSYGSMLELSWRGTRPIPMPDGTERKFILDGDTVTLRGWGEASGVRIGFGEARATVVAAP